MLDLLERVQAAEHAIRARWSRTPRAGVILGTGLGGLATEIETHASIPYEEIPYFPTSTVQSHAGKFVCGELAGTEIVAMEGRFHYYEGYSMQELTFPVRVMRSLGADTLVVSNACGGLNPQYKTGEIMLIEDHINLMGDNPLIGRNDDRLGPRFPDMCRPYDRELLETAAAICMDRRIVAHRGVYVAVAGPNLETRAEYRFLRGIGADVVGMSTVPEVLVAVHAGMRCLGLSVITDMCFPDALQPANVDEIIAVANKAEPQLRTIVRETIATFAK
jgi:purine-nucleoside phosphorylase